MVESDLFLLAIIDAYAFMVWPFMGLGAKREIYSGYEPSWIFAHAAPYWIQEMQEEKILPAAKELLKNGGVDEIFGYVSEEEISDLFSWLVPQTMAHHNMKAVIDTAKEFRCFEDFDYRNSRQKLIFIASGITPVQRMLRSNLLKKSRNGMLKTTTVWNGISPMKTAI